LSGFSEWLSITPSIYDREYLKKLSLRSAQQKAQTDMASVSLLSDEVLRQLSTGSDGQYFFDFSQIHRDHYEPLFRTLQRFALKGVDMIGFSCNRLADCQSDDSPLPSAVISSIAQTKIHYARNMVELLCYVVPKSSRLSAVHFSNLTIRREHLERLSSAFGKSRVLRSLHFSRVELQDDGFRALLLALNPNTLESVEIVKAGLRATAMEDILRFIGRRVRIGSGLRAFEVSPSEIPDSDRRRIAVAVSGRSRSPSQTAHRPARLLESEPEPEALSDDSEFDVAKIDRQGRIIQLREENRMLADQIKALKEMVDAVKINDSVFVVGRGAPDFVMYLNDIEQRLVALDSHQWL
jgi:hypothetical protein